MNIKERLRRGFQNVVRTALADAEGDVIRTRNTDLAVAAIMSDTNLAGIAFPLELVEFMRTCLEPLTYPIVSVKDDGVRTALASKRFSTLLDVVAAGIPPVESSIARDIGLIADGLRALRIVRETALWTADAGLLFSISSSFGHKGRLLSLIVRIMRSENCLELGTAFGMSAMFMHESQKMIHGTGRLTTVEGSELEYSLSSKLLSDRYGDKVDSRYGMTSDVLPKLIPDLAPLDLMFHDAAHSRDDYVRDFSAVVDKMSSGSVVIIDDIRWEDARFFYGQANTYQGFLDVAAHSRVRRAVTVGNDIGLLLLT